MGEIMSLNFAINSRLRYAGLESHRNTRRAQTCAAYAPVVEGTRARAGATRDDRRLAAVGCRKAGG